MLRSLFRTSSKDGKDVYYRVDWIEPTVKALRIASSVVLIVTPVGVLYLGELSKVQSFGVFVGFVVVFSAVMTFLMGSGGESIVAQCAYVAVLVTVLAQLSGGDGSRCVCA
jgi:hypothetical protein